MLKDDIFLSKDRTKFFDFIIPIIPVINPSNSYDMLKKTLEKQPVINNSKSNNLFDMFNNNFLLKLSLYLDDLRLLKNIINEFMIYYSRLQELNLDVDKLLAIMVYKNIFPDDFANFQINRGFVYQVFKNKEKYISEYNDDLDIEIRRFEKKIEEIKKEETNSKNELYALYFNGKSGYGSLKVNGKEENTFETRALFIKEIINAEYKILGEEIGYRGYKPIDVHNEFKEIDNCSEFIERLKNIEDKSNVDNLTKRLSVLKEKKNSNFSNIKLNKVIDRTKIENVVSEHFMRESNNYKNIKEHPYFDVLVFLIINGYIDEDYSSYITYFHKNSLTIEDKEFLRSVYDNRSLGYNYSLTKLGEIVNRLEPHDFYREGILNIDLFKYILSNINQDKSEQDKLLKILNRYFIYINNVNEINFIVQIYTSENSKNRIKILSYLLEFTPELLTKIILNNLLYNKHKNLILIDMLNSYNKENLLNYNVDVNIVKDYIDNNSSILYMGSEKEVQNEFIYDSIESVIKYNKQFQENLIELEIKFRNIDFSRIDNELSNIVYNENLYSINFKNIENILAIFYKNNEYDIVHKNYTIINNLVGNPIKEYIENNINIYISEYIKFSDGEILDSEESIYSILNSEIIDIELRNKYIDLLTDQKLSLKDLHVSYFNYKLINQSKLKVNSINILKYYEFESNEWTKVLIDYVNSNNEKFVFEWDKIYDLLGSDRDDTINEFIYSTILEQRLDDLTYEIILSESDYRINEKLLTQKLDINKVKILIKHNLIMFNKNTLTTLRLNYPDVVFDFINHNLSEYLELVKDANYYDKNELLNVLDSYNNSSVEVQKSIIEVIRESIPIQKSHYKVDVLEFILNHNFDIDDLPYLIQKYNKFPKAIQQRIVVLIFDNLSMIDKESIYISKSLLEELLRNDKVEIEKRKLLFSRNISKFDNSELKRIFSSLKLKNFIEVVNENKRNKKFERNEINTEILLTLHGRDLISSYKTIDNNYIVNSKKENNLI